VRSARRVPLAGGLKPIGVTRADSCSYSVYMKTARVIQVGVRELKNHLTTYLKLAKADHEVIVTERGRPIAVIQSLGDANVSTSLEARIA